MEGRWTQLAISASTLGYLDFSTITQYKPSSIRREALILREVENIKYTEVFGLKTIASGLSTKDNYEELQSYLDKFVAVKIPWLKPENASNDTKFAEEDEATKLIALYRKYQAMKEKEENGFSSVNANTDEAASRQ